MDSDQRRRMNKHERNEMRDEMKKLKEAVKRGDRGAINEYTARIMRRYNL